MQKRCLEGKLTKKVVWNNNLHNLQKIDSKWLVAKNVQQTYKKVVWNNNLHNQQKFDSEWLVAKKVVQDSSRVTCSSFTFSFLTFLAIPSLRVLYEDFLDSYQR